MISFDNTQIAFQSKSNAELSRSYWLFKLISNPTLVKLGAKTAPLALNLGLKGLFKSTIFKQFVGGEDINDCEHTTQELGKYNIGTILDYSVEGKESETDFEHCLQETLATIAKAKGHPHIPFCVFKVTGLARFNLLVSVSSQRALNASEQKEWDAVKERVATICKAAAQAQQPIFIDAEESWIQPAIDELANTNMQTFNQQTVIVYNTYQFYRHDRLNYLQQTLQQAQAKGFKVGAKLVRGAYMEKERQRALELNYTSPINANKADSDAEYDNALHLCLENMEDMAICAGSHNEKSSLLLTELMAQKKIAPNDKRIYFSQLLGMSDHISYNLSQLNYNVAKYVPYGPIKEVMPYLIRRAQENTSVKGQTGRELSLIIKEKERRRQG